jgi:hypothetical protein
MMVTVFLRHVVFWLYTNVSKKHPASTLNPEVAKPSKRKSPGVYATYTHV